MRARGGGGQVRKAARLLLLPHTCAAFKCYTQRGGPCHQLLQAALNSLLPQLIPAAKPCVKNSSPPRTCTCLHNAGIVLGVGLHVALDNIQRRHRRVGGAAGHDAAQAARHVKVLRGFGWRGAGGVGGSARQARACWRRGQRRRRRCVITTLPAKPFCWRGWRGVWHTQCGTRGAPRAPAGTQPARGPASAP